MEAIEENNSILAMRARLAGCKNPNYVSSEWSNWALRTGDWIAAASEQVVVQSNGVVFAGKLYPLKGDLDAAIPVAIKKMELAALKFGIAQGQLERFARRVCKRIARARRSGVIGQHLVV